MAESAKPAVLLVDDEPELLAGLSRALRSERFEIWTASNGTAALAMLHARGPFAAIVSDLRMPEMDGVALLQHAHERFPDTVRVLFTGQLDMERAIAAVNQGAIFRFILKPCSRVSLALALNAAVEQHRLVTAERVLLEQTLHGSIKALSEILALVAPAAFGRASRLRQTVRSLVAAFRLSASWHIEVAAMLSQVGCVTLPPSTLEKIDQGEALNGAEREMLRRMPAVVEQILGNIPRLEPVREILRWQNKPFDGGGPAGADGVPWGARALKLAVDLDALESEGIPLSLAFDTLRGREGWYDCEILEKLAEIRSNNQQCSQVRELALAKLRPGMTLAQDLRTDKNVLFIARGQEVTAGLLEKLRNFSDGFFREEPIRVILPDERSG
jgi:response regulator RpfG family c-di-GMP phosphodiesterase